MLRGRQSAWNAVNRDIVSCERCVRLRQYCQNVAKEKKSSYATWDYWGLPVPNFGDPNGRLVIVGLAPAAHGGNRTGRVFTGDRSGDWLYRALFKAGFANQPTSVSVDDGLKLRDCAITNPCHCAPPDNKPTSDEMANCSEWFVRTMQIVPASVIVALGQTAFHRTLAYANEVGWTNGPRPKFQHGREYLLEAGKRTLIACFHPSPRNTFTGKLTEPMFDDVFAKARTLLENE